MRWRETVCSGREIIPLCSPPRSQVPSSATAIATMPVCLSGALANKNTSSCPIHAKEDASRIKDQIEFKGRGHRATEQGLSRFQEKGARMMLDIFHAWCSENKRGVRSYSKDTFAFLPSFQLTIRFQFWVLFSQRLQPPLFVCFPWVGNLF